jgi:dTDP-4-amino-4,6-dideoxygalactose transaminase
MHFTRCERRDDRQEFLKEKNLETGVHYPKPNHLQPAVIGPFPEVTQLPNADMKADAGIFFTTSSFAKQR